MKTYMVDLGWGLTYRGKGIKEARADKKAIGVHEYHDDILFRTIYFKR